MFVHIIVNCNVSDIRRLWDEHRALMSDDILRKRREATGIENLVLTEDEIRNYTLTGICYLFRGNELMFYVLQLIHLFVMQR